MSENLRALNEGGREQFRDWVEELVHASRAGDVSVSDHHPPTGLLTDESSSFSIAGVPYPKEDFSNKLDFAKAMALLEHEIISSDVDSDCWPGIWDGLALKYFHHICRIDDGKWKPNTKLYYYCFDSDYLHVYRHLVAGPVVLIRTGGDAVHPFFVEKKPCVHGAFVENIGSSQELAGSPGVLKVVRKLYAKADGSGAKTGIDNYKKTKIGRGKMKALGSPGTLRRFVTICKQLRRTYDLFELDVDQFFKLLPPEFDKFR
jgi:hypothetical protein